MYHPCIILVEPQLGQNIGMVARAMKNFALTELRLVAPRDGWPNARALAAASGADDIVEAARFFPSLTEAIADLSTVYATSARPREMRKPVCSPREVVLDMKARQAQGEGKSGLLFGREKWGLTNDEVSLASALVVYPTNPDFASLNLAQAVLLFGYELFTSRQAEAGSLVMGESHRNMGPPPGRNDDPLATRHEVVAFFERLEARLQEMNYYHPPEKEEVLRINWQNLFLRAELTDREVKILHGLLSTLNRDHAWGEGSQ